MTRLRNNSIWFYLAVFGTLLRLIYPFVYSPLDYLFSDSSRHWVNADNLFNPRLFNSIDPIGYQIYIYILRWITQDNRLLVNLAFGLLSACMPWLYYRASRELGFEKKEAAWIWFLICWFPSLWAIYHYNMTETLLLVLIGLAIWMSGRFVRKGNFASFMVMVGVWVAAILTKPITLPLAIIFAGYACVKHFKLLYILAGGAFTIICLIPSSWRSYNYLGVVAPLGLTNVVTTLYNSNAGTLELHFKGMHGFEDAAFCSPDCFERPLTPLSEYTFNRSPGVIVKVNIDRATGNLGWAQADSLIMRHTTEKEKWDSYSSNIIYFLFASSWPESVTNTFLDKAAYYSRWCIFPLILFIFIGSGRIFLKGQYPLILVATVFFTLAVMLQNKTMMEGRYRKPVEPLLLMSCGYLLRNKSLKITQGHFP